MKKQGYTTLILLVLSLTGSAQEHFTIIGKMTGVSGKWKILLGYNNGKTILEDTALMTNGEFTLEGSIPRPSHAFLEILPAGASLEWTLERMISRDYQDFFLEPGINRVSGLEKMETAVISGGEAQKDFIRLQAELEPYLQKRRPLLKNFQEALLSKDTLTQQSLQPVLLQLDSLCHEDEENFIPSHPRSWVSLDLVLARSALIDLPTFEPLFNALDPTLRNSATGRQMAERMQKLKSTLEGHPSIDFTMNQLSGPPFSTRSMRGKYVLLDFWASWCMPCRAENPTLVKAYRQFRDRNFEIVSISLDEKREPWKLAVKKDSLTWPQLSDLKGWNNAAALKYGIAGVPQNFLLDPAGIIIARNLRGEELLQKLKQVLMAH